MANRFDELMEFPSIYTFKIIGKNSGTFKKDVQNLKTEDREWEQTESLSKSDNYISFRLTTVIENSDELEYFYRHISKIRDLHFYV
ncbi:DUF493 domain-containing protein [Flexistipes sp.]|uniref:DUF493 domain-containing protein n=1 Tax=Flexistipes sp. TaxID=3088135 RepID=UPI002E2430B8|nr:DUF493 domain-containing protein [Flexistipes sp.]